MAPFADRKRLQMCPKRAPAATALAVVLALACATPAAAAFWSRGKGKEAAEPARPVAAPTAEAEAAPRRATPAERAAAERLDALARAAFWGREVQIDPLDAEAGVKLAAALRMLGRFDEAAQAAQQVQVAHPTYVEAMLEEARARIGQGRAFYGVEPLKRAQAAAPRDWRPLSLLGVAYEQTERPDEALEAFEQALKVSPENPTVLTNLALFHATRGDSAQAETLLRRAVAHPEAGVRERQNLALVLGLQGKIAEAERLLRQDLPPEVAAANLAYLRAEAEGGAATRSWGRLEGAQ